MTYFRALPSPTLSVLTVRAVVLSAIGAAGCSNPEVGPCEGTRSDGLQTCGESLVRSEPPPSACSRNPDRADSCETDADCPSDRACYCGPLGTDIGYEPYPVNEGRCVPAACRASTDCGAGNHCVAFEVGWCEGDEVSFDCTNGEDECVSMSDCDCIPDLDPTNALTCGTSGCGRPFLVEGIARVPGVAERRDWSAVVEAAVRPDPTLAAFWLETARLEHASVAAFARFTMELLALAAPADLVAGASKAMADEIEHARIAFGLASRHAGTSVGPTALAIDGALAAGDVRSIVERLFLEGCVGETLAAATAREVAARVGGADRAALLEIADDETAHAALAWRTLAWLLETHRTETERGIADARARLESSSTTSGLLDRNTATQLRAETMRLVVEPALGSLGCESLVQA
jgi:hypothetical protein